MRWSVSRLVNSETDRRRRGRRKSGRRSSPMSSWPCRLRAAAPNVESRVRPVARSEERDRPGRRSKTMFPTPAESHTPSVPVRPIRSPAGPDRPASLCSTAPWLDQPVSGSGPGAHPPGPRPTSIGRAGRPASTTGGRPAGQRRRTARPPAERPGPDVVRRSVASTPHVGPTTCTVGRWMEIWGRDRGRDGRPSRRPLERGRITGSRARARRRR